MKKYSNLLKKIPLFQALSETEIDNLSDSLRRVQVKQGQIVFRRGDEATGLYIVNKGSVKIVLNSKMGYEIIVAIFSEGDFFGEASLLDGEPRPADAISIVNSEILILARKDFMRFLNSDINAIKAILAVLTKRLKNSYDQIEDLCFLSISERLAKLIVELAKIYGKPDAKNPKDCIFIDIALSQKEIGDMIGATRESINKEIKVLKEKSLIKMNGKYMTICNLERLKRNYKN